MNDKPCNPDNKSSTIGGLTKDTYMCMYSPSIQVAAGKDVHTTSSEQTNIAVTIHTM